jgi:uncharacterized delta-60 repeat protein
MRRFAPLLILALLSTLLFYGNARADVPTFLDQTFGTGGIVQFEGESPYITIGTHIAIQPDDKILVTTSSDLELDAHLWRLNKDGSPDNSFGTDGSVMLEGRSTDVLVLPDGDILTVGYSPAVSFAVQRWNSDGTPHSGTDFTADSPDFKPLFAAVQADGKTVIVGRTITGSQANDVVFARFKEDGTFDPTFGTNGQVTIDFSSNYEGPGDLLLDDEGRIIYGLMADLPGGGSILEGVVVRLTTDGNLDPSFNGTGRVMLGTVTPRSLALQSDGRIMVSGNKGNAAFLMRINENGSLDSTYGDSGIVLPAFVNQGGFSALALQPDDKAIVTGGLYLWPSPGAKLLLTRFNTDGTLDDTFGNNGIITPPDSNIYSQWGDNVALDSEGRSIALGISPIIGSSAMPHVLRYIDGPSITPTTTSDVLTDDDDCTLREAIIAANTNSNSHEDACAPGSSTSTDIITLADGATYSLTIAGSSDDASLTGDLDIIDNPDAPLDLIINVAGSGSAIISQDTTPDDRVLHVLEDASIKGTGVTFTNGTDGIFNEGGTLKLYDSAITDNTGGGISNLSGTVTLDATTVSGNSGGGINNRGTFTIQNSSLITENSAEYAAGIYNDEGTLVVDNSIISNNTATNLGGGLFNEWPDAHATIQNGSVISGNSANAGAGIKNHGVLVIDDSIVTDNHALATGGAVYGSGSVTIQNGSLISDNTAGAEGGGAIGMDGGTVLIEDSTVSGNSAENGGALYSPRSAYPALITITNSMLLANTASGEGGVFYNDSWTNGGSVSITGNCVFGNSDTAIYNATTIAETATGNWWGAGDGPSGAGPGSGDSVSANVDYSGFLTTAPDGCPSLPSAPTDLSASLEDHTTAALTWTDNASDETAYKLERSTDQTSWTVIDLAANAESYDDSGLACNTTYYYRVRAYRSDDTSYSGYSNTAQITTDPCSLIPNGSFEINVDPTPLAPDGWTPKKLQLTTVDGLDTTTFTDGAQSFRIKGNGTGKKLIQVITTPGAAGNYTLSFDAMGEDVGGSGNFMVKVKVFLPSGDKKNFKIKVTDTGDFGWTGYTKVFSFPAYTKLEVTIQYTRAMGTVWIDDLRLFKN